MEAIILAGGFGTRLKSVVKDLPKPMAPVAGRPFLEYVLREIIQQGVTRIILSVGYKSEAIKAHFGGEFEGAKLLYSVEKSPLGTGGGILMASSQMLGNEFFVLNGDTLFKANLKKLKAFHQQNKADLSLTLKPMQDFDRYGTVKLDETGQITAFQEKNYQAKGLINGGVYCINTLFLKQLELPTVFSFEKDLMERFYKEKRIFGLIQDAYFIDIGIPEDFRRAGEELG